MKRLLALLLCVSLFLIGCQKRTLPATTEELKENTEIGTMVDSQTLPEQQIQSIPDIETTFGQMNDVRLLNYMEDAVYSSVVSSLNSTDFFVQNVQAIYISKEYLDEVSYNSKTNVFFGYSLAELDSYFQGKKYIFTLGENGDTVVREEQKIDDTLYADSIKNIAIGGGVILVCVVISVATEGAGAPAAAAIFAASAKTGAICALSASFIGGASAAIVKGYQTQDFDQSMKAALAGASEGFKWGAISGAVSGGVNEAIQLKGATLNGLSMNEAAVIQKESGYPLSVIKQFHTYEEYSVFKDAGLRAEMLGGNLSLVRSDIDLYNVVDDYGRNNYVRMSQGLNPIDGAGKPFEWHHIGQESDGTLALLNSTEHDAGALHGFKVTSEIDRSAFDDFKKETLNPSLLKWLLTNK